MSCSSKQAEKESNQTEIKAEPKDQISFIREKFKLITSNLESSKYVLKELITDGESDVTTYKRAMNGEDVVYAYVSNCDDHGCHQSSYYFWDNKLIFKFDQNSSWVSQSDKISEHRIYYLNEEEILCLQRTKTGSGGYKVVNKLLSKMPQDTLQCKNTFDRSTIKAVLEFTNDKLKVLEEIEDSITVEMNLIHAENDKFLIQVDRLIDNSIRYRSWNKPKEITEEPDLILTNGLIDKQGTGGGYYYIFENNDWQYVVKNVLMAETDEGMGVFLELLNKGEEKLNTKLTDLTILDLSHDQEKEEIGEVESHYICYTEDSTTDQYLWIRFYAGEAKQIKYKGNEIVLELVFDKESENLNPEGSYPVYAKYYKEISEGKVTGVYKLTHSGNYDYAEYVRGSDSKVFKFTIDFSANPYGLTPCF